MIDKYQCTTLASLPAYGFHSRCISLADMYIPAESKERREEGEATRRYLMVFAVCSYSNLAMCFPTLSRSRCTLGLAFSDQLPSPMTGALRRHALPRRTVCGTWNTGDWRVR